MHGSPVRSVCHKTNRTVLLCSGLGRSVCAVRSVAGQQSRTIIGIRVAVCRSSRRCVPRLYETSGCVSHVPNVPSQREWCSLLQCGLASPVV